MLLLIPLCLLMAATLTACFTLLLMGEVFGANVPRRVRPHPEAEELLAPGDIAELREAFERIAADHLAGRDLIS